MVHEFYSACPNFLGHAERTIIHSIMQRKIIRDFEHFYKNNTYGK